MSWLCFFGHDYEPMPHAPGVSYIGSFGGGKVYGPEKCRRCGAAHQGMRIPPPPPELRARWAERDARKEREQRWKHLRSVLQRARRAASR